MDSLAPVPEPRPKIVGAGEEAGVGGTVNDETHRGVVPQAQQLLPAGVPGSQYTFYTKNHDTEFSEAKHTV